MTSRNLLFILVCLAQLCVKAQSLTQYVNPFLWPVLRSDVNGEYFDARGQVVKGDFRYYMKSITINLRNL